MSRPRRAFTLVELLVVIGIITVLIGILLPATARSRQSALQLKCAAQLRQLGQAFMAYASGYRGSLPGWSGWHNIDGTRSGAMDDGPAWTEMLQPFFVTPQNAVYNCPNFPDGFPCNYFLEARWISLQGRRFMRLSEIKNSSQFVLSGDCTDGHLYPPPFGWAPETKTDIDKDDATDPALVFFGDAGSSGGGGKNMHAGGNNVLFADGHVSCFKRFDPQSITFHPRLMQSWEQVTLP